MIKCGICGLEIQEDECFCSHSHTPDFYLNVWNCKYQLKRIVHKKNGTFHEETLPFNLPEDIAHWVIEDTCGGSINQSGKYRLPGVAWEFVLAMMRDDHESANLILTKTYDIIKKKESKL